MRTMDFAFDLPNELIAQNPAVERDLSRMLVFRREDGRLLHRRFRDIREFLIPGDVLVLNDTRVLPARLRGAKRTGGAEIEVLLLTEEALNEWWVLLRPGKRVRPGTRIDLPHSNKNSVGIQAEVLEKNLEGHCRVRFFKTPDVVASLTQLGEVPLPPYILRDPIRNSGTDQERYQTVFAREPGSVAAPTAGLHFTHRLLDEIRAFGVGVCFVTLHVGLGTFAPVKTDEVERHVMHSELFHLNSDAANAICVARKAGHRVIAVGTTTLRVLETVAAANDGQIVPAHGRTEIFIYPPRKFRCVDALITNFHLPQSTLLMLASAFAAPGACHGRELILSAYAEAIQHGYRFYSYGDAMLIL